MECREQGAALRVVVRGLALLVAAALASPIVHAGEDASVPRLSVFVGRLADVRELKTDCGENCWNFDSGYQLKYSVLETLSGEASGIEESFDFFGHYGLPAFAHYDTALLFVFKDEKASVMARYLAFPVTRTRSGTWAFCGDPYPGDMARADRPPFRRVAFDAPVASSGVTAGYREDAEWSGWIDGMKPGRKHCRKAVLAEELVAYFQSRAEPGYNRVYLFSDP